MKNAKVTFEVPNGGWGWMVVLGAALINTCNQSLLSIFGLLFGPRFTFLQESESRVALVMNLCGAFSNLTGLVTGPLIRNFTSRSVAMCGSLLVSLGLITSSMTTSLNQLIFTYSLLVGTGLGIITPAVFMSINSYFNTKRARALGFAMAGTGFGQMMMPQIVRLIYPEYGFQGTLMVIGALSLHGVLGAMLFQPAKWHMKISVKDEEKDESSPLISPLISSPASTSYASTFPSTSASSSETSPLLRRYGVQRFFRKGFWSRIARSLDLSLLKDIRFLILNWGLAVGYTVSIDFTLILPLFLQSAGMLDRGQAAICMSVLASFDLISRLTFHFLTDYMNCTHRTVFMIGTLSLGVVRSILAEQTTYLNLIISCMFFGYFRAFVMVNQILTISEYCAKHCPEKLPGALGLNQIIKGVTVVVLGQMLGSIRDLTQSYTSSFHIQNILLSIVMIVWVVELTWYKR